MLVVPHKCLLPLTGLRRHVAVLAGGAAAAQAINALVSPLLTRLYSPEDFGAVAVYGSMVAILAVGAGGRYNLAIPLPQRDEEATDLLVLSLGIVLVLAVLFGAVAWNFGNHLLAWTGASSLDPYLWLFPLALAGSGVYQVLTHWAIRRRAYGTIACTRLQQSTAGAAVGIGVGALSAGPLGLLLSTLAASTAGARSLAKEVLMATGGRMPRTSLSRLTRVAIAYRKFPMYSMGAGFLNSAGILLPPILMSSCYGPTQAGLFALAHRVVGLPMALLGQAVANVFFGEASRAVRGEPDELRRLVRRIPATMMPLAAILMATAIASPCVFGFLFGSMWHTAGVFAALLALSSAAQLVVSPISSVSSVLHRTDLDLWLDGTRAIVTVLAFLVPSAAGFSPMIAVAAYAGGRAAVYAISFVMYRRLVERLAPGDLAESSSPDLVEG